jgi:hypothetical protein
MSIDKIKYLQEAISVIDRQINLYQLNPKTNKGLIQTLQNQKLHFQEELYRLNSLEQKKNLNSLLGIIGLDDDEEEINKIFQEPNKSQPKTN